VAGLDVGDVDVVVVVVFVVAAAANDAGKLILL
jgi:hypothetical protein